MSKSSALQQTGIALNDSKRCAQLMRGVGHKLLLFEIIALQECNHPVEGMSHLHQFILGTILQRQPPEFPAVLDLPHRGGHLDNRPHNQA
ncbi:hypothetical protein D3C80_1918850 [compost metagenome]